MAAASSSGCFEECAIVGDHDLAAHRQSQSRQVKHAQSNSRTYSGLTDFVNAELSANESLAGVALIDGGMALVRPATWRAAMAALAAEQAHAVVSVHAALVGATLADAYPPFADETGDGALGLPHGGLLLARREAWLGKVAATDHGTASVPLPWPEALDLARTPGLDEASAAWLLARYAHRPAAPTIKLVVFDIDGVMTDAGFYYDEAKQALKKFSTRDGQGLVILRDLGVELGIITGERTGFGEVRARGLQIKRLALGTLDKLPVLERWRQELGLEWNQIAYMGDDLPDLPCLRRVGVAACPADAEPEIQAASHFISTRGGGHGAVRDFIRYLITTGRIETTNAPDKVRVYIEAMLGGASDAVPNGDWGTAAP